MKTLKNIICILVTVFILLNTLAVSIFAADQNNSDDATVSDETTSQAIMSSSVIDDETVNLDANDQSSLLSTAATSFYAPSGGTLRLDYIGQYNVLSQTVYTKVVYLSPYQTTFFLKAFLSENTDTFIDYLKDQVVDEITEDMIDTICNILTIVEKDIAWQIVGFSIDTMIWMLDNLSAWDLDDAVERSTTGKIKIEYYYITQITFPYYQSIENFEPWNSDMIEVPEDYNYEWEANVYDCEYPLPVCEHTYGPWVSKNNNCHVKTCTKCYFEIATMHTGEYTSIDSNTHRLECTECDDIITTTHSYKWISLNSSQHKGTCSDCGQTKTELHSKNYDETIGKCLTCGYKGAIMIPTSMMKQVIAICD